MNATENNTMTAPTGGGKAVFSLVLGIFNLLTFGGGLLLVPTALLVFGWLFDIGTYKLLSWFLPVICVILPTFGIRLGRKSIDSQRPKTAMTGIVLNAVAVGLSFAFGLLVLFLIYFPPRLGIE
jgi:hypothetical protein